MLEGAVTPNYMSDGRRVGKGTGSARWSMLADCPGKTSLAQGMLRGPCASRERGEMDVNSVIVLMWVAGFLLGSGLTLAFFPNLSRKGKIVSVTLTFVAVGLLISMVLLAGLESSN